MVWSLPRMRKMQPNNFQKSGELSAVSFATGTPTIWAEAIRKVNGLHLLTLISLTFNKFPFAAKQVCFFKVFEWTLQDTLSSSYFLEGIWFWKSSRLLRSWVEMFETKEQSRKRILIINAVMTTTHTDTHVPFGMFFFFLDRSVLSLVDDA